MHSNYQTSSWIDPTIEWSVHDDIYITKIPSDQLTRLDIESLALGKYRLRCGTHTILISTTGILSPDNYVLEALSSDRDVIALVNWARYKQKHSSEANQWINENTSPMLDDDINNGMSDPLEQFWGKIVAPDIKAVKAILGGGQVMPNNLVTEQDTFDKTYHYCPETKYDWCDEMEMLKGIIEFDICIQDVFLDAHSGEVILLLSRHKQPKTSFLASELSEKCRDMIREYKVKLQLWEKDNPHKKWNEGPNNPTYDASELDSLISVAFPFESESLFMKSDPDSFIKKELVRSSHTRPRDGVYQAMSGLRSGSDPYVLVIGTPYSDARSSYPEIKACLQKHIPQAFKNPRIKNAYPPNIPVYSATINDQNVTDIHDFEDTYNSDKREKLLDEIRKTNGLDAIAWYAPYHLYDDQNWGIYFDSAGLDQFAWIIYEELRSVKYNTRINPFTFAGQLAFGSVYAHELFHAKVEAALSWLELTSSEPRYISFKENVYNKLRLSEDWLEEALANWSSLEWVKCYASQNKLNDIDNLLTCYQQILDLSPPGYKEWRKGSQISIWRKFTTQLTTGEIACESLTIPLPSASLLTEPFPYDFLVKDIPVRFIGDGVIANSIQGQESNFPHLKRKELIKALKYFGYTRMPKFRGKGSHEMWQTSDNRGFPVPGGKSISHTVVKSFLNHCGLTKNDYIRARPLF